MEFLQLPKLKTAELSHNNQNVLKMAAVMLCTIAVFFVISRSLTTALRPPRSPAEAPFSQPLPSNLFPDKVSQTQIHEIQPVASAPVKNQDLSMMPLTRLGKRRYTYTFAGTATYRQAPSPNASVLVRVTAGDEVRTAAAITDEDGSYAVTLPVIAADDTPVDWSIEAYTPDFKKVELVGRRIATEEDRSSDEVTLNGPLAFRSN